MLLENVDVKNLVEKELLCKDMKIYVLWEKDDACVYPFGIEELLIGRENDLLYGVGYVMDGYLNYSSYSKEEREYILNYILYYWSSYKRFFDIEDV